MCLKLGFPGTNYEIEISMKKVYWECSVFLPWREGRKEGLGRGRTCSGVEISVILWEALELGLSSRDVFI